MYPYGPPHMAGLKQDNQLKHTFSSYVRISGERGSGISVLVARQDDDDNNSIKYSSLFQQFYNDSIILGEVLLVYLVVGGG